MTADADTTTSEPRRRSRRAWLVVAAVYLVPLAVVVVLLVRVGLWQVALGLAVVEAVVAGSTLWARPGRTAVPRGAPGTRRTAEETSRRQGLMVLAGFLVVVVGSVVIAFVGIAIG